MLLSRGLITRKESQRIRRQESSNNPWETPSPSSPPPPPPLTLPFSDIPHTHTHTHLKASMETANSAHPEKASAKKCKHGTQTQGHRPPTGWRAREEPEGGRKGVRHLLTWLYLVYRRRNPLIAVARLHTNRCAKHKSFPFFFLSLSLSLSLSLYTSTYLFICLFLY